MLVRRASLAYAVGLCLLLGCGGLEVAPAPGTSSLSARPAPSPKPASPAEAARQPAVRLAVHEAEADAGPAAAPEPQPPTPTRPPSATPLEPRTIEEVIAPHAAAEVVEDERTVLDLDFTQALAMAGGQSPQIAYAAARYREAYARLEAAHVLWLPSLRAGVSFNHHDGPLQETGGNVVNASRSSFQAGMGVRAVGAGSPATPGVLAEFHTADAFFQPTIAGYVASARQAATEAATNDTLLAAALAYLDLLRARQQVRIAEQTRDNAQKLADLTASFARSGQGPQADADRAQTELVRRRNEVSRAEEAVQVATARLAEVLSLDPAVQVIPQEATIVPIDLVAADVPLTQLVATGLSNRPELAEAQSLVCEAVNRYRRERYAPLVPSLLLGISQSGYGGGTGSDVNDLRGRFDFDAAVYWELRNAGFGARAKRDETRAQYDQTLALQARLMDRVAREVVEASAQVQARKGQIAVAESGIKTATDSYNRNLTRIRQGEGLPIEVLQSLQALDEARREYLRTLADYNEAQFRLQRALGWPIQ